MGILQPWSTETAPRPGHNTVSNTTVVSNKLSSKGSALDLANQRSFWVLARAL